MSITDQGNSDNLYQTSESNTDIDSAYEIFQHSPSNESDPLSTTGINYPIAEDIPQDGTTNSRGGK